MNTNARNNRPNVVGGQELVAKYSAVNEQGGLNLTPIHELLFRPTRPVPHEDGHVTEIARTSWDIIKGPVVQVHQTTTFPGRNQSVGAAPAKRRPTVCSEWARQDRGLRWPPRFTHLRVYQRVHCKRKESRAAYCSAKPLPRLEEHWDKRSDHHQHADCYVQLRRPRRT